VTSLRHIIILLFRRVVSRPHYYYYYSRKSVVAPSRNWRKFVQRQISISATNIQHIIRNTCTRSREILHIRPGLFSIRIILRNNLHVVFFLSFIAHRNFSVLFATNPSPLFNFVYRLTSSLNIYSKKPHTIVLLYGARLARVVSVTLYNTRAFPTRNHGRPYAVYE